LLDMAWTGLTLGVTAGISPGPLLVLLLTETLRHGRRAGVKVAFAPLLTDLPLVVAAWLLADRLAAARLPLALLSVAGGVFVAWLGLQNLRPPALAVAEKAEQERSLGKAVVVNLLSPHPWMFWGTVGAPLLARALRQSVVPAVSFIALFYLGLIGAKVILALLSARHARLLQGRGYRILLRLFGVLLILLGLRLLGGGISTLAGG